MKKLVAIVSLVLVSTYGFSQENTEKNEAVINNDTTTVETVKTEVSKDSTETVAYTASKRAIIESNFDKSIFLFRGRKSKNNKLC